MISIKPDALWGAVRDGLRQDIPTNEYDLYISGIRLGSIGEDKITVEVLDSMHQYYAEQNLLIPMQNRLERMTGQLWKLELSINPEVGKLEQGVLFELPGKAPDQAGKSGNSTISALKKGTSKVGCIKLTVGEAKPEYSFASYVRGPSNQIGIAATERVATLPNGDKGVVLLYGGVGLGKTHLLHATAQECLVRNPKAKIALISATYWVDEFVEALQKGRISEFRSRYRSLDLLLVDDVQQLVGKERSQDEFFHIYNWLQDRGKKMVFTCDKLPQDVTGLEDRLVSRFTWGLTAYLSPPDYEMRCAILENEIAKLPRNIAPEFKPEVIDLIAQKVRRNVRWLESSVMQVSLWVSLNPGKRLDLEMLEREILRDTFALETKDAVSPEKILRKVSALLRVKEQEMRGAKRTASLAWARQIAMYLCRKETSLTLQEISFFFGKKDHGTVMHAVKKVEEKLELDPKVEELIRVLLRELQA